MSFLKAGLLRATHARRMASTVIPRVTAASRQFSSLSRVSLNSGLVVRNEEHSPKATLEGSSSAAPVLKDASDITMAEFFQDDRFNPDVRKAVKSLNFSEFTPVQEQAIIPFLNESGVVCKAKTGTGKTFSFVIPLVNRCMELANAGEQPGVIGLVIAPTRDLARQIFEDVLKLTSNNNNMQRKVEAALWCGGTQSKRFNRYRPPQIVIGTPGRVLDNIENRGYAQSFAKLEYRVFDEADRLLDQGFETQLLDIDDALQRARDPSVPALKNTLFSATVDRRVTGFAVSQIGRDFRYINCVSENDAMSHEAIEQELVHTQSLHDSLSAAINHMLEMSEDKNYKGILFLPTKVFAQSCFEILRNLSGRRNIWRLHGDMSQSARDNTTTQFKKAKDGLLVCTDVAARGMDYKNISEVLQVGLSREVADYVHKIGRTGRAGALGKAKLYLVTHELPFAIALSKDMGIDFAIKTKLDPETVKLVFENTSVNPGEIEDQCLSLIGALKSFGDSYKLDIHAVIKDIVDLYRTMLGDSSAKLFMTSDRFNKIALPTSLVPEHIEVDNANNLKYRGSRHSMRSQFNRNTRGGRDSYNGGFSGYGRRNDRFGAYRSGEGRIDFRNSRLLFDSVREMDDFSSGYRSKRTFR